MNSAWTKRSPLFVIAGFLLISATVRVGLHTGNAIAAISDEVEPDIQQINSPVAVEGPTDKALEEMVEAIQKKSKSLRQREEAIASQELALNLSLQALDAKISELKQAEKDLLELISISQKAAQSDIENLTSVYASMKPKDAARLFEEMDPEFAAGFLGQMIPEDAAGIMAGLTPQKAYAVSVLLAGRNANAPTD